jgi:glycosyltransferase involved in cell wall biosynthesis
MVNVLLIPINDLKSHPMDSRFVSMGKSLVDRFNVNIFILRYKKIPTESKTNRKLSFELVDFNDIQTGNIGSYYFANAVQMFSALSKVLKKKKIDVIIHANILPSTIAVGLGKIFHVPVIFDYQDHFPESAAVYFKGSLTRLLVYAVTSGLNKINVKYSDAIVTVTNAHRELIKKLSPGKTVEVIPNGVDTELFKPIRKDVALKNLNMPELDQKIVITYFGSIDSWLDFTTVFKALKRLANKGLDVLLLLIGYSHSQFYLEEIKKTANDIGVGKRVYFLGPVPQKRLVYYINASDVTLAPFRELVMNQAVPLKILESMACGIPVCATGLREIAQRFKGFISLYSSEEELESELLKYIGRKMAASAKEMRKMVKEYSWDGFAESYYQLIIRVIKEYQRRITPIDS